MEPLRLMVRTRITVDDERAWGRTMDHQTYRGIRCPIAQAVRRTHRAALEVKVGARDLTITFRHRMYRCEMPAELRDSIRQWDYNHRSLLGITVDLILHEVL